MEGTLNRVVNDVRGIRISALGQLDAGSNLRFAPGIARPESSLPTLDGWRPEPRPHPRAATRDMVFGSACLWFSARSESPDLLAYDGRMKIAITGSSGFIGAALVREAHKQGHDVVALVRETSRRDHLEPLVSRFVVGTHEEARVHEELLDGVDAVIHNSFDWHSLKQGDLVEHMRSNMVGSIDLLQAAGDRHFIYMSSIAVHHQMHPDWNGRIDETHPLRPGNFYGALKAAVEAHMWAANAERGQPVSAIRPCAVYGIDPTLKRSIGWPIIHRLRAGDRFDRKGGGKFVHVDDVAAATVACLGNSQASPAVYNLVDCYARWGDWATIAAELLGVQAEIDLSSPPGPKNTFDSTAVRDDLGVRLDRGFDGIRAHLDALIARVDAADPSS